MASTLSRWFGKRAPFANGNVRNRMNRVRGTFERFESRDMMHAEGGFEVEQTPTLLAERTSCGTHAFAAVESSTPNAGLTFRGIDFVAPLPTLVLDPAFDPRQRDQQMGLPLLDSNPGAPVTIYLDFTGNVEADWWYGKPGNETHFSNVVTPIFSMDTNTAGFSSAEAATIKEVWARVAEDFAPFNINVSTAYYGSFENGKALRVAIGGQHSDWLHYNSSGIASIGSFSDSAPNTVFVFDVVDWAKRGVSDGEGKALVGPAAMATTISHEAGHSFGLRHHSRWAVDGTLLQTYDTGTSGWTPIMGNNLASDRTTWEAGPTDLGANSMQFDMDILSSSANVFGYKPDDHGDSIATADPLTSVNLLGTLTGKGIIGQMRDVDYFKFTTNGGAIRVKIDPAQFGPNLIPIAELWSSTGFVSRATSGGLSQSIIDVNVAAGTYYVQVKSLTDYGDVGQYTVSVTQPGTLTTTANISSLTVSSTPTTSSTGLPATVVNRAAQPSLAVRGMGQEPLRKSSLTTVRPRLTAERHDAFFATIARRD